MYRNKRENDLHHNFLFDHSGIGDIIAALPALKYICDFHPHVIPHVWVPDYILELVKKSLPKKCIVRGFSEKKKYNPGFVGRGFNCDKHTSLSCHLTDYAFFSFINTQPENKYKNYIPVNTDDVKLERFNLPEKFVVLTTGFTAPVRELLPEHCNYIITYIKSLGYGVVFLGKEEAHNGDKYTIKGTFKEEINFSSGINLLNKTTLLESLAIIKRAKTIVGLDNGLLHLAGTTDIPIVGGFTTVEPRLRMPYRKDELGWNYYSVVPPESLACRFCQSNMQFTHNFDFKNCYYDDYECLKQTHSIYYINELEKILL